MNYTDRGIIVKRTAYGETDYILTLLSANHGKFTALAKGVRKITSRRGGHLDLFSHILLSLHVGSGFDLVTEVETLNNFATLRGDLEKISSSFFVCEVVNLLLPDGEKNYSVYRLVLETLNKIDSNQTPSQEVKGRFAKEILMDLGYWSAVEHAESHPFDVVEEIAQRRLNSLDSFLSLK